MSSADVDAGVTRTTRRVFTAAYKAQMVAEYDAASDRGARGALLRREGLFDSHIGKWRRAQQEGRLAGTPTAGAGGGGRSPASRERALSVENERLRAELETTKAVLDVAGKVSALLETLSESAGAKPRPRT
ncbi:MAG: transposase [Intrasporangium sp.]|uniref:transposase n=1 Tax=Intrasporangium sp. TaxID=1925024 RepID=UPI002647B57A|nr:transposase [Intrasporangium sp.]MDN5798404.1 transposase [Intrasporangium sp.]